MTMMFNIGDRIKKRAGIFAGQVYNIIGIDYNADEMIVQYDMNGTIRTGTINMNSMYHYDLVKELDDGFYTGTSGPDTIKCECGSQAIGSPKHSHYCPLYKKD